MVKVLTIMLLSLMLLHVVFIIEFIDLQGTVSKVIELNEQRAAAELNAAELNLKNERMRNTYYKVLLDAQGLPEDKR